VKQIPSSCRKANQQRQHQNWADQAGARMKLRLGMLVGIISLLICSIQSIVYADDLAGIKDTVPELKAVRIENNAPSIDGSLDDEIWQNKTLDFARNFLQRVPDDGKPATESTLAAIAYDDAALYIAFWCYESDPSKISRQLTRRDNLGNSDAVTVRLDPYHDHQTGNRFDVTASGVQLDYRYYENTLQDETWDAVWQSGVKMQAWGWTAEIRIPYNCLRFNDKEEHVWGVNVTRYIARRNESPWWAYVPVAKSGFVSNFGHLTGLKGIKPARHLEVLPFAVSALQTEPKNDGNPDGRDFMKNTGLDVKYGLSSNLILDFTANPDFGQVELDQPVLNLSTYETFYGEKRPFFMEGADMFNTRYNVFYSRRIGCRPNGYVGDTNHYTSWPKATTILGAAKLTGKFKSGTSIAFLNALTQEEKAEYVADSSGHLLNREGVVEPMANYSVFRIQQDIFNNSSIGGILTLASQKTRIPISTGGIDWRLLTKNGIWGFSGQAVYSRRGVDHTGYGFSGGFDKLAGKHVKASIGFDYKDTKLNLNRLGYLGRNDEKGGWAWFQYRTEDDWWIFKNTYHNINLGANWNHAGNNINKYWNYNDYIEFTNFWSLGAGFNMNFNEYDDRETRGNGLWKEVGSWNWWASLNTDSRKKISFCLNPGSGTNRSGTWWAHYTGINYRPTSYIELSAGTNFCRGFNQYLWLTNVADSSIFARADQDEWSLDFSANVMFSRDLSLRLSGQGYVSGINYHNYGRYLGGIDYASYDPNNFGGDQDFNYAALNSTLLLKWEYMPGSTLYLVWTRAMSNVESFNNLDVSRDLKRLFSGDAENVFLVKASYWWNP
jgi:hypothetical protein